MSNEYTRIDATEATAGDEFYSAATGEWEPIAAAYVVRGSVKIVHAGGGSNTAPAHHFTVRRRVVTTPAPTTVRMGNGVAVHLADASGALCNRWGTVNGRVVAPKPVPGATATCKRCQRLAANR